MMNKLLSLLLIIFLSPVFAIVAFIILINDGYPVIYRQKRVGLNNINFYIYKYRTMKTDTPDIPTHMVDDPNKLLIKSGRLLRKYSLDELPQLFNILKGQMKFVGPRPALHNQEDLIELRTQVGIHTLVPGVTGLAQISGRDELSIPEKVKYDHEYFIRKSVLLDINIIYHTISQVLMKNNIKH
jgi:O-antigen biosynthesis protein WbqP